MTPYTLLVVAVSLDSASTLSERAGRALTSGYRKINFTPRSGWSFRLLALTTDKTPMYTYKPTAYPRLKRFASNCIVMREDALKGGLTGAHCTGSVRKKCVLIAAERNRYMFTSFFLALCVIHISKRGTFSRQALIKQRTRFQPSICAHVIAHILHLSPGLRNQGTSPIWLFPLLNADKFTCYTLSRSRFTGLREERRALGTAWPKVMPSLFVGTAGVFGSLLSVLWVACFGSSSGPCKSVVSTVP